jgi:hypothetical protein
MTVEALLGFSLLALVAWLFALPGALYFLVGAGPVRGGGRGAMLLFAGGLAVPAVLLAGALVLVSP